MKAISLTQPWAHLVMLGAKQWETRSWSTKFRGQIAIHASKNYPNWARDVEREPFYREVLLNNPTANPFASCGRIIAIAAITDCQPTERFHVRMPGEGIDPAHQWPIRITPEEYAFGDYGAQRFAFKLERVLPIPQIECKGALGLWTVPDHIAIQILDDLKHLQSRVKNLTASADG